MNKEMKTGSNTSLFSLFLLFTFTKYERIFQEDNILR